MPIICIIFQISIAHVCNKGIWVNYVKCVHDKNIIVRHISTVGSEFESKKKLKYKIRTKRKKKTHFDRGNKIAQTSIKLIQALVYNFNFCMFATRHRWLFYSLPLVSYKFVAKFCSLVKLGTVFSTSLENSNRDHSWFYFISYLIFVFSLFFVFPWSHSIKSFNFIISFLLFYKFEIPSQSH